MKTHLLCSFRYKKVRLGILKESASCFFALIFSLTVYAQEFAPYGAMWHYTMTHQGDTSYYTAKSVDSTVIDGKKCRILEIEESFCYFRDETVFYSTANGDSIYWYEPGADTFQLIYAFNAQQGESWSFKVLDGFSWSLSDKDSITLYVDSVSSKEINGIVLPVQHVTYHIGFESHTESYTGKVIKHLGDTLRFFNFPVRSGIFCDAPLSSGLRCYEDNYLGFYETGIAPSCKHEQEYLSIEEKSSPESVEVNMYPNPAYDRLNIEVTNSNVVKSIEIFDMTGRKTSISYKKTNTKVAIDISGLKAGSYMVVIEAGNIRTIKHLFVQH